MKSSDIILSLIIIIIFLGIYAFNTFSIGIDNIKQNWPVYRCNPTIMPFASWFGHDPVENFTYCIQNMQTSYMGNLLKPTNYAMSLMHNLIQGIMDDINWIRKKIENMVSNLLKVVSSIFGVFINILIQFQRIMIKIKDTIMKVIATVLTLVYVMEGGIKVGESTMAGPIGSALKFVCFHPNTKVDMADKTQKPMCEVDVGDILKGGSKVMACVKLRGNEDDPYNIFYKLYSNELEEFIYVTGNHYIFDKEQDKFIKVKHHKD
jgi:hypothetical protein